jgi:hypothetical protein
VEGTEDCLFINVYTPKTKFDQKGGLMLFRLTFIIVKKSSEIITLQENIDNWLTSSNINQIQYLYINRPDF